ncbi:mitochondrial ribosomal protein L37-domain-containing protein [Dipodascopsis uninucleata]
MFPSLQSSLSTVSKRQVRQQLSTKNLKFTVRYFTAKTALNFSAGKSLYEEHEKEKIVSSVPAGTRLRGCGILNGGNDPEALADDQYPDWLWELLDDEAQQRRLEADPERKARKEWRKKMRQKIKTDNFLRSMK